MKGLSSEEARAAQRKFGLNALPPEPGRSIVARFFAQLNSALIHLLLFALGVDVLAWALTGFVGAPAEALAILGIVVLNAALGLLQEYRSERALLELERLSAPRAWAQRDGSFQHLDASELVPADVVRLEAGDRVPADGVAHEPEGLSLDESVLTGESLPVDKAEGDELSSGTVVSRGRTLLVVSRTGAHSRMGKLALSLGAIDTTKTPLEQRVEELGRRIARIVAVLCLVMVGLGFAVQGFQHPLPILMFAVAFGVAVVPEGMPAMMTLALAFGVQRMARRRAVVRRLAAVEALGSVTVIATDKTGTLTENELTVQQLDAVAGREQEALLAMVLANDADPRSGAGDPLDLALLEHAARRGADVAALRGAYPRLSSRGFDSQWGYMRATVVAPDGQHVLLVKGAPEAVLALCRRDHDEQAAVAKLLEHSARRGLKVLALASGSSNEERNLKFLGLVSLGDPPRPEAKGAVRAARRAGIRVVMITGDHAITACAIAREVGIDSETAVEGSALGGPDAEIDRLLEQSSVFARMKPEHKLRLIERLQARGAVVAMTGDGLNDAPALKRADVGVAMGARGSDVAREVADLVLLDDNFASIVAAVEEGRSIYANVQSFVRFSFSSNVALMILVLGAAMGSFLFGLRQGDGSLLMPLTALQILWINFLGDGPPALAIALDSSKDALGRPPRPPEAPLLDRAATRFVLLDGAVKGGIGLGLLVLLPWLGASFVATASAVFIYEGIAKLLSMFPARRLGGRLAVNHFILWASALSVLLQLACVVVPWLRSAMGLVPLGTRELLAVGAALLTTYALGEVVVRAVRASWPESQPVTEGS